MNGWDRFAENFLNARIMERALPDIAAGFVVTVELAAGIVVCGIAAGLALALVRSLGVRPLNWAIVFVVDLFRALPPLVLIVLLYFGLPGAGVTVSGFVATWLTLSLVLMAFAEEIFWAGLQAVPPGQREAARSLGLGFWQAMRLVQLPQALRLTIPPLTNRTIAIIKGTALGSVVAVSEILSKATAAVSFTSNPSPLVLAAAAYLLLFVPVVVAGRAIERRFR
jgi:polar amino acid transport system permease protein